MDSFFHQQTPARQVQVVSPSRLAAQWWFVVTWPVVIGVTWLVIVAMKWTFVAWLGVTFLIVQFAAAGFLVDRLKTKFTRAETAFMDGDRLGVAGQVIDLSRPYARQISLSRVNKRLWIDLSQGANRFGFEVEVPDADKVTKVFWSIPQNTTLSHPPGARYTGLSAEGATWPWVEGLLSLLRQRETNAQPWPSAEEPEPGIGRTMLVGLLFLAVTAGAATAAACLPWVPLWASIYIGLTVILTFEPWLSKHSGAVATLTAWLSVAGVVVGALYASDYVLWRLGPAVTAADLSDIGASRFPSRPKRRGVLAVRNDWGTTWTKRDSRGVWTYTAAAPVATLEAKRTEPIGLWTLCQKSYAETDYLIQRPPGKPPLGQLHRDLMSARRRMDAQFERDITKVCQKQWKRRVVVAAQEEELDHFRMFLVKAAKRWKLTMGKELRLVFFATSEAGRMQMLERILIKTGMILLFGWSFAVLWVRRRRVD